jgi:hypothetical protein
MRSVMPLGNTQTYFLSSERPTSYLILHVRVLQTQSNLVQQQLSYLRFHPRVYTHATLKKMMMLNLLLMVRKKKRRFVEIFSIEEINFKKSIISIRKEGKEVKGLDDGREDEGDFTFHQEMAFSIT